MGSLTPTTSFGEVRGHRGGIVAVVGRVKLLEERAQPLAQLWIGRVVGWAKLGAAKPMANPTRANSARIFMACLRGCLAGWGVNKEPG
jgi:hypothetical protein